MPSEARLASLFAIAKGDIPPEHWDALGRPPFAWNGAIGLLSGVGSMSEYLMSALLLDAPAGSLLQRAALTALAAQRAEARARGVPWGSADAAIAERDPAFAWLRGAHGSALLARRRPPADELVVAPHASLLALRIAPAEALANLRRMQDLGARQLLGFADALDYTPQRQLHGSDRIVVDLHDARHQALGLIARSAAC